MDPVHLIFVFGVSLLCAVADASGGSTEPNAKQPLELELYPPKPTYAGQTRMPRTLFKKLHSGAAFLTGLKLGAILSKKGFELGHGKIASTHSFQLFGKSVNSAMSLSYGNVGSLLPLVDDETAPAGGKERTGLKKEEKKVFQVTVVESPSNETTSGEEKQVQESGESPKVDDAVLLYQDVVEETPETETNFIDEHNKRVKEFNNSILRRKNSKF